MKKDELMHFLNTKINEMDAFLSKLSEGLTQQEIDECKKRNEELHQAHRRYDQLRQEEIGMVAVCNKADARSGVENLMKFSHNTEIENVCPHCNTIPHLSVDALCGKVIKNDDDYYRYCTAVITANIDSMSPEELIEFIDQKLLEVTVLYKDANNGASFTEE
jgi:PleD family two-component response regulator